MKGTIRRAAIIAAAVSAPLAFATVVTPAVGQAAECGVGTEYDAPSNSCVGAPVLPPPPPPPAPVGWNGDLTPGFGVGPCVPIPIPFVPSICGGI
ncbi:hypothetical protein E4P42_20685 [Mycobacterium sp. PS03-16]|uniref:hypothetical protein n=1 Tax=Mycobacterium sp. PS03-16 TaxID=2559611 RepID=UPI0010736C95|nr:hypothetical protein [Mycobacterium sp. PS03-16]TFV56016.1 hypothetical protein E4P42_20685 [Mycobacterium sp. PS03-16]